MAQIPEPAKGRLLYLMRVLEKMGTKQVTSHQIEALTGWSSVTVRKDVSYLDGDYGGTTQGYDPALLIRAIKKTLDLETHRRFCVVGLGRLGSAYLNLQAFHFGEFELVAGFDISVNRVEILKSPVPLYPAYKMAEIIRRFSIEIALLCVPDGAAQETAKKLAAAGIRGILNFAPVVLTLDGEIAVRNVYVVDELRALSINLPPVLEL
ncbi:MAG: redox-sensing transcriptional repressor Rex [Spirochaetaceae bacterium]|jgi:redox-sensing transcriptional repressor|nr:redox-sensing transcriptional repressor Rex [Spirochaetaceae bacterium]